MSADSQIGARIRAIRKIRGLTQTQFAERLDWPQSKISKMERGGYRIYVDDLLMIADTLQVNSASLINDEAIVLSVEV